MPRKSKRQLAALKGWDVRRKKAQQRARAARKGWETRRAKKRVIKKPTRKPSGKIIAHKVTIQLSPGPRGKRYGQRDFIVPAPRGASFTTLKRIAKDTMTGKERDLLQFWEKKNLLSVEEGPATLARKAQLR